MILNVIMTKYKTKKDIYDYDETKEYTYDENTNKRKMYEGIVFNLNNEVSKEFNNIKNQLLFSFENI